METFLTLAFVLIATSFYVARETAAKQPTACDPAIETHITGDFSGWDSENIYKMDDGSIWQQSAFHYHYHYSFHPAVIIYKSRSGACHIKVTGDDDPGVDVERLK